MMFGKSSAGNKNEKKSARPYKNERSVHGSHSGTASQVQTTALPRSQRPSRQKQRRRKPIGHTILLLLLMVFIAAGAFFAIRLLNGTYLGKPVKAFQASEVFTSSLAGKENMRAQPFAQKLCVSSKGSVDRIKNASLEEGQKGLLFNLSNHKVLYANGIYDKIYPASITKIMTAMLALKSGKLDDTVTITQENVTLEAGSQVCGFVAGDQVTLDQLLHCLLVYSGNDAASAIATHVGGSTENFVAMMNEYAAQLGCTGTHFTNPHGLQDENHYTTPYDIYLMLKEALKYPEFTEITQLPSYTVTFQHSDGSEDSVSLTATDHYLTGEANAPKGVTVLGGKTGTTSSAGNCLALLCQNSYGEPYVSTVMGASTKELLYQQMTSLLENINTV